MTLPPVPGPAEPMKTFKVSVPESAYQQLEQQAAALGIFVKQHVAPVVIALAGGQIRGEYSIAAPPAPVVVTAPPTIRERLAGVKGLSGACRTVFAAICEAYELSGGQRQADTNRELAQALNISERTARWAISRLEVAGWLHVRLFAGGGDGRHLWPTDKARIAYGALK